MKLEYKLIGVFVIFCFCLSPIAAADFNQNDVAADNQIISVDNQNDIVVDAPIASENFDNIDIESLPNVIPATPLNTDVSLDDVVVSDIIPSTRYAYVFADVDSGVENQIVHITPTVYCELTPITEGILNIYSDYHRTNLIASVAPGSSFDYTVPDCPDDLRSKSFALFYEFNWHDDENNIDYFAGGDLPFYTMHKNNIDISASYLGDATRFADAITVKEGESFILNLDHIDFRSADDANIFVEGFEDSLGNFWLAHLGDTQRVITLDPSIFAAGEYAIYVVYDGCAYDQYMAIGNHIAPAISNMIKVTVLPKM